jgi:transposase
MSEAIELTARIEKMEQEVSRLNELVLKTEEQRDRYHQLYMQMMERYRKLELGLMGKKAERFEGNSAQLSFQMLQQMLGDKAVADVDELEVTDVRGHERHKPTGRKLLPEHLPRVDIEIIPEEVQRQGWARSQKGVKM